MPKIRSFRRPLIIMAAVIIVDVIVRLVFGFQMSRIVAFEAVLFGATSLLLLVWAARREGIDSPAARRLDLCLVVLLALGSLRAGLWAGGLPVSVANLVVLGVSLLSALGYGLGRWLVGRDRAA